MVRWNRISTSRWLGAFLVAGCLAMTTLPALAEAESGANEEETNSSTTFESAPTADVPAVMTPATQPAPAAEAVVPVADKPTTADIPAYAVRRRELGRQDAVPFVWYPNDGIIPERRTWPEREDPLW